MRYARVLLAVAVGLALVPAGPAFATSAPDKGKAFVPRPASDPVYGTKSPDEDPETQRHYVTGHDGTDLYVETWLPAEKDGRTPPAEIPTILIMTPYVSQGVEEYPGSGEAPGFIDYMTSRGYAVAQHHVRGTGESGGCLEQTAENQIQDGAYVVEYLGKDAPWSDGKVGMYGISYDAETQISTAGLGDPKRIKYLKAIVPAASVGSQYDWNYFDGVPWVGQTALGNSSYLAQVSLVPGQEPAPQHYPEKLECQGEVMGESGNTDGDYTEYWQKREYRPGAPHVKAATLYVHGLRDFNVQPITLDGFFDRLPKSTPHKGLVGVWNHAFPSSHGSVEPDWARPDWLDMVTAWYDRYLKDLPTKVEKWPAVQVQSSNGQWWATNEFPPFKGPVGQLSLGPDGKLGLKKPKGETAYTEQLDVGPASEGEQAVFETRKLKKPLQLSGQPMLDLWLVSSQDDGHISAKLEVIGADGTPMRHAGSFNEAVATYGYRSLQHLDPIRNGTFYQAESKPAPVDEPMRVQVRFLPTDLLVPKGATLRLTISGQVSYSKGDSQPSGAASTITLLHKCGRVSALRFLMPNPKSQLLNVRENDEIALKKLPSRAKRIGRRFGGRVGTRKICGQRPQRIGTLR